QIRESATGAATRPHLAELQMAAILPALARRRCGRSLAPGGPIRRRTIPNRQAAWHPDNRPACWPGQPAYSCAADALAGSPRRTDRTIRRRRQTACREITLAEHPAAGRHTRGCKPPVAGRPIAGDWE